MTAHEGQTRMTLKALETRQRILESAVELFREKGFEETTMRDVAKRAGVATGATYYYFASKDALVLEFYVRSHAVVQEAVERKLARSRDLRGRIRGVIAARFEELAEYRTLFAGLFRSAADPSSALSPFGDATREIREQATEAFAGAIEDSDVKLPADLKPHLPRLLWLYQMGLILFWIYDGSKDQARTWRLLDKSLDVVVGAIKASRFRVMAPVRRAVLDLLLSLEEAGTEPADVAEADARRS